MAWQVKGMGGHATNLPNADNPFAAQGGDAGVSAVFDHHFRYAVNGCFSHTLPGRPPAVTFLWDPSRPWLPLLLSPRRCDRSISWAGSVLLGGVVFHSHMPRLYDHQTSLSFPGGLANRVDGEAAYGANLVALADALVGLRAPKDPALAAVLSLPSRRDDLAGLREIAGVWRQRFDEIVVLGTGGSSLGGRALTALVPDGSRPWVRFSDNLDPYALGALVSEFDPRRTGFVVISKSGATPETVAQALVIENEVRRPEVTDTASHFLAICETGASPIRTWAETEGITVLDHDPALGGRFSVLSLVGLLPALMAGLDAGAVREGANQVLEDVRATSDPGQSPPVAGAALSVALMRACGIAMSVLMPYADRLAPFALWYRQLWAESLGKRGLGSTPVHALGPADQHSQLQLYVDGPADKLFTLLVPALKGTGPRVPPEQAAAIGAGYLGGVTAGDLVAAQLDATARTLAANGRPTRVIELPRLDERALGGLFMHFMLETILAAHLLEVSPFGQPAVEEGKVLAREALTANAVEQRNNKTAEQRTMTTEKTGDTG